MQVIRRPHFLLRNDLIHVERITAPAPDQRP